MSSQSHNNSVIICTNANINLGMSIAKHLQERTKTGYAVIPIIEKQFADTSTNIELLESVRGKIVYVISTASKFVNDNFMSTCLIVDACKNRSGAKAVNVIFATYPYARSDKRDHRGPIAGSVIATMLQSLGVDRVISCDIHAGQIQGFYQIPFDNIYCKNILACAVRDIIAENPDDKFMLCSPDAGGMKRIDAWSESLGINNCFMYKQRDYTTLNKVASSKFIGDPEEVKGKYIIIVDDIADTMGTMMACVEELSKLDVLGVYIVVTHAYLNGRAIELINGNDLIVKVICTDSIPQEEHLKLTPKLHVVSMAPLLSEVIYRIQGAYDAIPGQEISLSKLFD